MREESRRWSQLHEKPFSPARVEHANDRNPDRRLRVGYLFANPHRHFEAVLSHHDRELYEIFAYSNVQTLDPAVRHMHRFAEQWRRIAGRSDEEVFRAIVDDQIDILVDMAGHAAHNRLLVFARRPAPVQLSHLGIPVDSGLESIPYRISDEHLDPPGATLPRGTLGEGRCQGSQDGHQVLHLPCSYWCYLTPMSNPAVSALPAREHGFITFGTLNDISKLTSASIQLWSQVLRRIPTSRLLLLVPPGKSADQILLDRFEQNEIARDRIELVERTSTEEYLKLYARIDIGLDPVPYNGHTTSIDSLWMGVPIVTLRGTRAVGRGGVSLLSSIGMSELIAGLTDAYVQIATDLANDLPKLQDIRENLRARVGASCLVHVAGYTREVEAIYRDLWHRWCRAMDQ